MRRAFRWLRAGVGLAAGLAIIVVGVVYGLSERQLKRVYAVPLEQTLDIRADSGQLAAGAHLVRSAGNCVLCHGEDLGGAAYIDGGVLGVINGPNLTSGRGGIGGELSDADWERAIRHGIRRNGTSLIVMPSEIYAHMSDEDVASVIAYIRSATPVDRELPPTQFRFVGRALLAAGRLPLLVAAKTPVVAHEAAVAREPTAEYGRYLADIGGCHGCHGFGLSGGRVAGGPDLPPSSNLTPAGIGDWTEEDFVRAMREGLRPDGVELHEFMPWRVLGRMTDDELHAIWLYLGTVPPKEFGGK